MSLQSEKYEITQSVEDYLRQQAAGRPMLGAEATTQTWPEAVNPRSYQEFCEKKEMAMGPQAFDEWSVALGAFQDQYIRQHPEEAA